MKNQCQHTGQNAAFKLLFSHIPIREILKKDEKSAEFGERFDGFFPPAWCESLGGKRIFKLKNLTKTGNEMTTP